MPLLTLYTFVARTATSLVSSYQYIDSCDWRINLIFPSSCDLKQNFCLDLCRQGIMFCISYTLRNEEVLLRVYEQRNILHEIRKRKANWIGHILRRNCLLQQVIEGKIKGQIEVT